MTKKLYDENSYLKEFTATVTDCESTADTCRVLLDRTTFFPEGGGQAGDTGLLNNCEVLDTQEENGLIWHYTALPILPGTHITGQINWQKRFDRMQQHSAEHIVSGLIHKRFHYNNVGFHLGEAETTLDFDGPITKKELLKIEQEANRAVWDNLPIEITYPSPKTLTELKYRSKIEIEGQVRIVTIPGIDICACCAPHVSRTGEIGLIKLTGVQSHRGGVRICLLAGARALTDYEEKEQNTKAISALLSVKEKDTAKAVDRLKQENYDLTGQILKLKKSLIHQKAAAIPDRSKNAAFFEQDMDAATARELVNLLTKRCTGIAGVFIGTDATGYRYILGSASEDVRPLCRQLNEAFHGKGGGKPEMVQGTLHGTEEELRSRLL